MARAIHFPTARVFGPLVRGGRYLGAWGGRGSAKSHFFAEKLIEDSICEPSETGEGLRSVCIREVQKDLAQSSKLLLESKLKANRIGEADGFKVYKDVIATPRDGIITFKGMNDYTADSIKSLEGFKRAWWEEGQTATAHSLQLLRPTIRTPGSQLWFSWNPRRKTDALDVMLRGPEIPTGAIVVRSNWRDNPWLTPELEQERLDMLRAEPDQYGHVWEGEYVSVVAGAYYAKQLNAAKAEGRTTMRLAADPLMTVRAFIDIGGTGAKADAFAMWIAQFVGREIRVLDYYEAVGQELGTHLAWLRKRGWQPDIWLPHDGATHDKVHRVSYESALKAAGYRVTVVPNQGAGAATARIEAARRLFPSVLFHAPAGTDHDAAPTCEPGLAALGWYHEKKDDKREIGLGPEHDWSSHGADAFGLMAVAYEQPTTRPNAAPPKPATNWIR
jgi:phage terminase large subunit